MCVDFTGFTEWFDRLAASSHPADIRRVALATTEPAPETEPNQPDRPGNEPVVEPETDPEDVPDDARELTGELVGPSGCC